jgi:hypothetical protein
MAHLMADNVFYQRKQTSKLVVLVFVNVKGRDGVRETRSKLTSVMEVQDGW